MLPQYPFNSQIGVALAQSLPAGGFPTQDGGGGGATTHIEKVPVPPKYFQNRMYRVVPGVCPVKAM